jgi:DNA-nicking Smr family endonuclease
MTRKPPSLDASVPRRRRLLSAEERALWEEVVRSAKPLKRGRRAAVPPAAEAPPPEPAPPRALLAPVAAPPPVPRRSEPPKLATLGRRERSQLARGRKEIEARIDLHGMTQERAHRALKRFLEDASDGGLGFVLVITGKGSGGADKGRGVLRRQVPEWLALPDFRACVVGFEEAHIGHGGGGALYVRIRRARRG